MKTYAETKIFFPWEIQPNTQHKPPWPVPVHTGHCVSKGISDDASYQEPLWLSVLWKAACGTSPSWKKSLVCSLVFIPLLSSCASLYKLERRLFMKQENITFGWLSGINFVSTRYLNYGALNNICDVINLILMFSQLAKHHNSCTV